MDIIRNAEKNDFGEILRLYRQLSPLGILPDEKTAADIIESISTNGFMHFVVIERDGMLIAACCLAIIPNISRGGRSYCVIENVVTDESCRRQGIGKKLMSAALDIAKENNCYKVMLMSGNKRVEAHRFYEAIGFDGTSKRAFEMRLD
jgi:N-acetylglutamate synthase-like GNAT family acetyltransferase